MHFGNIHLPKQQIQYLKLFTFHDIGILIKLCKLKASSLFLGEANRKELAKFSLSGFTVKTHIVKMKRIFEL